MTPYYERNGITIFCGECSEVMSTFEPDTFDLTVTSPPYDNLRDYEGYTFDFEAIAQQLWRVTAQGGVVVWVVGDATINGSETGTSFRQALRFMEIGFNLHDTMIYQKDGLPFPDSSRYYQVFEYMFVFSKDSPSTKNLIRTKTMHKPGSPTMRQKDGTLLTHKYQIGRETKILENVWRYSVGYNKSTKDSFAFSHPAQFPEALARDHIISWSNPSDLVLDPMCGSGTTLKMAQQLGRRAVGIEISEEYCKIAVERLRQPSFFSISALDDPEPAPEQKSLFGDIDS